MNALRAQIIEWQKVHKNPEPVKEPTAPKRRIPVTSKHRELVAGGDILWKPVNREAAKLLSPASWIYQPIEEPKYEEKDQNIQSVAARNPKSSAANPKKNRGRKMKLTECKDHTEPFQPSENGDGKLVRKGGPEYNQWIQEMAEMVLIELNKTPSKLTPLAKSLIDARTAVEEAGENIGMIGDEFDAKVRKIISDTRSSRLAIVTETHQIVSALKDVRAFFLGSDHEKEINRLREFVDLCERLQKLKDSGFLDNVVDTMLKMS